MMTQIVRNGVGAQRHESIIIYLQLPQDPKIWVDPSMEPSTSMTVPSKKDHDLGCLTLPIIYGCTSFLSVANVVNSWSILPFGW